MSPLWRKKSSNFEARVTELGSNLHEYYLYVGSAEHNICNLSDEAILKSGSDLYEFKHRDVMLINDEVIYYNGILRKLKEEIADEA